IAFREPADDRQGAAALHRQQTGFRTANVRGYSGSVSAEDIASGMKIVHWVSQLNCTEKGPGPQDVVLDHARRVFVGDADDQEQPVARPELEPCVDKFRSEEHKSELQSPC